MILNLDFPSSLCVGLPLSGIIGEEKGKGEKYDIRRFVTPPGRWLLGGQAPTHPAIPCPCVPSSSPWISGAGCQTETNKYSASNKGQQLELGPPCPKLESLSRLLKGWLRF